MMWTCYKNSCICYFKTNSNDVNTEIINDQNYDKPCDQNIIRQKLCIYLERKTVEEISVLLSKLTPK